MCSMGAASRPGAGGPGSLVLATSRAASAVSGSRGGVQQRPRERARSPARKVSATFPGSGRQASGGRLARPVPVVSESCGPPHSGLRAPSSPLPFTCARRPLSVRAGPVTASQVLRPKRHHALALQEEKQRQIQPNGAGEEVRGRPGLR